MTYFRTESSGLQSSPTDRWHRKWASFPRFLPLILAFLVFCPIATNAQGYLYSFGQYPWSVPYPVPQGYVDLSNGDLRQTIPIASFPERGGIPFSAALVYDSHIWQKVTVNGSTSWQPTNVANSNGGWRLVTPAGLGNSVSYTITTHMCTEPPHGIQYTYFTYSNYQWINPEGRTYKFPISTSTTVPCHTGSGGDAIAQDASGYHMYATSNGAATVYSPSGTLIYPNLEDTNGNYYSAPNGNGDVIDTLGRPPITTTVNGGTTTYAVLNSQNGRYNIVVTTTSIAVNTAFGQSGVTEYSGNITVVQSIGLPDGTSYSFNYDTAPTGTHYGTLTSVTLPTGGTVTYEYANFKDAFGNQNVFVSQCSAGGGTWTYSPLVATSCGTSCSQWVTVTKPSGDAEVHTFTLKSVADGAWDTQQQLYTGPAYPATLLKTVAETYDFTNPPYIQPLSITTTVPIPGGTSLNTQTQFVNATSNVGNIITMKEWDFYSGSLPTSPDRTTNYTYLSNSNNNMVNKKTSVQIKNKAGAQVAYTAITYDSTSLTLISGVINHDDTNFGTGYTARGNPTLIQQSTGGSNYLNTTLTYDTTGQDLSLKDPAGNTTTLGYADSFYQDGYPPQNPPQNYTGAPPTNAYLTSITPPSSNPISLHYYFSSGKLAFTKDQNGNSAYLHYLDGSWDRLTHTYLPLGWYLKDYTGVNILNLYQGITDTNPSISCSGCRNDQLSLDNLGRPSGSVLESDPDGATSSGAFYDANSRVGELVHPHRLTTWPTDGNEYVSYDGLDRILMVTHADGDSANVYYGAAVTVAGGISSQLCSSTTYGLGYPTLSVDEAGKKRQSWTDGFGRTIEVDEPDSSGNLTLNTCYQYDALDNLTQVVQANSQVTQTRTYAYDSLSRATSLTTPESGTTTFSYTLSGGALCSGNLAAVCIRTDAKSIKTNYTYDASNRLTGKSYSDGTHAVTYSYDQTNANGLTIANGLGRLTSMSDASGTTAWSYDGDGRITAEKRTLGGVPKTTTYAYNLDGSLSSITYPTGRTITYTTSNAQRELAATDGNGTQYAMTASYAPPGELSGVIYGPISGGFAGVTESLAYNNRLETNSIQATSSAGTALNLAYCFGTFSFASGCSSPSANNNWNVTGIQNTVDNGRTVAVTYDNLNHVSTAATQATSGPDCWGQAYSQPPTNNATTIDRWNNLLNMYVTQCSVGGLSISVDQTKNQINAPPGYQYDLSGNGNMVNDGSYSYTYDAQNRISSANGVNYTYDGEGLRVEKSNGTLYWRAITGDVLTETDLSGNTRNEYVYFAGQRVAWWDGSGNLYYIHADELGTTRTITQSNGTVCYDADFTPFGQEIQQKNNCPSTYNYKFTGYERDPESGLDYAIFRYYNPRLGRFMSPDPLGGATSNPQTLNRYSYVANNPINFTDPLGLHCRVGVACSPGVDPMWYDTSLSTVVYTTISGTISGDVFEGIQTSLAGDGGPISVETQGEELQGPSYSITIAQTLFNIGSIMPMPGSGDDRAGLLQRGLNDARNRLKKKKCNKFFGGKGSSTLDNTQYMPEKLPDRTAGAQTNSPTSVFINSDGPFYDTTGTAYPKPLGSQYSWLTGDSFRGFILLHELGHQLSDITGFVQDAGPVLKPVNVKQSLAVIAACF